MIDPGPALAFATFAVCGFLAGMAVMSAIAARCERIGREAMKAFLAEVVGEFADEIRRLRERCRELETEGDEWKGR